MIVGGRIGTKRQMVVFCRIAQVIQDSPWLHTRLTLLRIQGEHGMQ